MYNFISPIMLANAYMEEVRPRSGREAGLGHVGSTIPWMESVELCLEQRSRSQSRGAY